MKKKCTISIIGFGKFGALAAAIFEKHSRVLVYHYKDDKQIREKAKKIGVELVDLKTAMKSEVVVLAVPISKTEELIKNIAPLAKKGSLIVDTCSVKIYPCQWLKKYAPKNVEIMGTHPMFGPVTTKFDLDKKYYDLKDKQIVLCPLRIKKERLGAIKKFLENLGLEVIVATPEEHDREAAKSLSLVHFLGRSLTKAGAGEQKIFTPGYLDLLKIIPHTNSDKWQLFCDMNNFNPYAEKIIEKFQDAGEKLIEGIIKSRATSSLDFNRRMIDEADKEITKLLSKRFQYVKNIGRIKKKQGLKIIDKKREAEIIKNKIKQEKLDGKFIKNFYKLIFREAYRQQN